MHKYRRGFVPVEIILAVLFIIVVCSIGFFVLWYQNLPKEPINSLNQETTKSSEITLNEMVVNNLTKLNFVKYNLEKTKYTPSLPNYQISLSEISNINNFQKADGNFSEKQNQSLSSNNFFIAKNNDKFYLDREEYTNRNDDWTGIYETIGGSYAVWEREPENSVFITTDFLTHVYHKLIDEEFTYIEEANFYPTLLDLSKSMLISSSQAYSQAQDTQKKDSFERLSAYFLVTSSILENASTDYQTFKERSFIDDTKSDTKEAVLATLGVLGKDNNVSEKAKDIARQEIELIFDAKDMGSSPLMGSQEDYTQYGPRSHYAKNVILRDYFRAMMYYGRMNFLLKSTEQTRDAININLLLNADQIKQWESIYQPTSFFVGQTDDLTIYDYNQAANKISFKASDESDTVIAKLQSELATYKDPQIMSSVVIDPSVFTTTKEDLQKATKGFRFMGQRFTPDAFIFSTLTQGDELPDKATGQSLPSTPTALMVSTLMGSKTSSSLLNEWIKNNAPESDKVLANRMATLQDYFNKTTQAQWTQNIYWSWLYSIKSLFNNFNIAGYPMFMKSDDWNKKNLQGFLGSFTELKHDTLLYAKQSYAEKGGGGGDEPPPAKPVPKGYVEPNIDFFDRLIALVNLSNDGLKQFDLLPSFLQGRNTEFVEALKFYKSIAVSELENKKISDDDFEKLRLSAGSLDQILKNPDSEILLESNARSAIIADVHTDVKTGKILYEADGIPNYIYVAVKDVNGTRLTKGLVYSYYEFTNPVAKRLTDQDWQNWSYTEKSKVPEMPWWNKDLVK